MRFSFFSFKILIYLSDKIKTTPWLFCLDCTVWGFIVNYKGSWVTAAAHWLLLLSPSPSIWAAGRWLIPCTMVPATEPPCPRCSHPYRASFAQHQNQDFFFVWWWRLLTWVLLKKQSLNLMGVGVCSVVEIRKKYFCAIFTVPLRTRVTWIETACFIDYGCLSTIVFFLLRPRTIFRQTEFMPFFKRNLLCFISGLLQQG